MEDEPKRYDLQARFYCIQQCGNKCDVGLGTTVGENKVFVATHNQYTNKLSRKHCDTRCLPSSYTVTMQPLEYNDLEH